MPDLQARLIEAAVRPLDDDAEMKLAARHLLGELVKSDAQGAEEAIVRWEAADSKRSKPVWQIILWVLLVVVSAGVAVRDFREVCHYVRWLQWAHEFSLFSAGEMPVAKMDREYTTRQKLLLFGDPTKSSKSEKKEALWQSEPENVAFYAEYASAYASDNNRMPPHYRETARRMAPENAWFTYQAAAVEAREAMKAKTRKSKMVAGKRVYEEPKSWEILDQGRMDRSLELIREARMQPKWNDYSAGMLMERMLLLPRRSFIECLDMAGVLADNTTFSSIRLRLVSDAISAKAWSLGQAGDVAGFREISKDGEHFLRGLADRGTGTLVDEMVGMVCVSAISESFADAAGLLGLQDDAAHWRTISDRLNAKKSGRDSRAFLVDGKAVAPRTVTGGLIGGTIEMVAKQPELQPPLTDEGLKPGRLLDHEILSRFFSYASWVVVAVCLGAVAAYRFRVSRMVRRLAGRMEELLNAKDWGWVMGAGVLLPFAFVMAVNRLTPLGGRQFGVAGSSMILPAAQFLGLLLLWLVVPGQVVRWRLGKRAGVFGFPSSSRVGWLAVACAVAFIPVIGWAVVSSSFDVFRGISIGEMTLDHIFLWTPFLAFRIALGSLGISLLWVVIQSSAAIFSSATSLIFRATSSMVLIRVYAAVMLLLVLASIGFKASEQYWFDRDMLSKIDSSEPGWSHFEYQVAVQMRKEFRETLGYEP